MNTIRDAILERMSKLGLSIYQVSKMLHGRACQRSVYSFLTGRRDTGTEAASAIMDVLGLAIEARAYKPVIKGGDQLSGGKPKSFLGRMKAEWSQAGKPEWSPRELLGMCLLVDIELGAEGLNPAPKFRDAVIRRDMNYVVTWVNGLKFPWDEI